MVVLVIKTFSPFPASINALAFCETSCFVKILVTLWPCGLFDGVGVGLVGGGDGSDSFCESRDCEREADAGLSSSFASSVSVCEDEAVVLSFVFGGGL